MAGGSSVRVVSEGLCGENVESLEGGRSRLDEDVSRRSPEECVTRHTLERGGPVAVAIESGHGGQRGQGAQGADQRQSPRPGQGMHRFGALPRPGDAPYLTGPLPPRAQRRARGPPLRSQERGGTAAGEQTREAWARVIQLQIGSSKSDSGSVAVGSARGRDAPRSRLTSAMSTRALASSRRACSRSSPQLMTPGKSNTSAWTPSSRYLYIAL